jgi:hypothetical protein
LSDITIATIFTYKFHQAFVAINARLDGGKRIGKPVAKRWFRCTGISMEHPMHYDCGSDFFSLASRTMPEQPLRQKQLTAVATDFSC